MVKHRLLVVLEYGFKINAQEFLSPRGRGSSREYPHSTLNVCRSGATMGFQRGRFDNWCVYFQNSEGVPHFYLDHEYFATMRALEDEFGGVFQNYHDNETVARKPHGLPWR